MYTIGWSQNDTIYLEQNFDKLQYKEIAKNLNKTPKAIKARCIYLGLCKKPRRKYNEKFFDEWSSEMSYILGFIMADGCVETNGRKTLSIQIHEKDIEILNFINSKLCNENIIEKTSYDNQFRIRINSPYIVDKLISLGIIARKTGYESMKFIPDEWKSDFIRGYFDGDGSISICKKNYSCYICGSNCELMKELINYFNFGSIRIKIQKNCNKLYYWSVQRKYDLELFRKCIYNKETFSLERKKSLLLSVDTKYKKKRNYNY
jgi:hypothetical protein